MLALNGCLAFMPDKPKWLRERLNMRNRCIGSGEQAQVPRDGIGHACATCGMLTIPFKNGTVRPHSVLGSPPPRCRGANPPCQRCGGPHPFDTTVPSAVWNAVIRARGLQEYLCLTCIVEAFGCFGGSFTATLWGGPFHGGLPIEVIVNGEAAKDAARVSEENTALRARLRESNPIR